VGIQKFLKFNLNFTNISGLIYKKLVVLNNLLTLNFKNNLKVSYNTFDSTGNWSSSIGIVLKILKIFGYPPFSLY
jgi:hypothetical protein